MNPNYTSSLASNPRRLSASNVASRLGKEASAPKGLLQHLQLCSKPVPVSVLIHAVTRAHRQTVVTRSLSVSVRHFFPLQVSGTLVKEQIESERKIKVQGEGVRDQGGIEGRAVHSTTEREGSPDDQIVGGLARHGDWSGESAPGGGIDTVPVMPCGSPSDDLKGRPIRCGEARASGRFALATPVGIKVHGLAAASLCRDTWSCPVLAPA